MMKRTKKFDCVQMKNNIQSKLLSTRKGMTDEQVQSHVEKEIDSSQAPAAELWRRIKSKAKGAPTGVASRK